MKQKQYCPKCDSELGLLNKVTNRYFTRYLYCENCGYKKTVKVEEVRNYEKPKYTKGAENGNV